jgi:hypothetical protein
VHTGRPGLGDDLRLPDGWQRCLLKDLCSSIQAGPGITAEDRTEADDGVPLALPRDLVHQRIVSIESVGVVWDKARTLDRYRLTEGDILVTRTGTVGRCALVTQEQSGWLYHANLVRLRLKEADLSRAAYVTGYLSAATAQNWIKARAAGSVIPSVSTRALGELPLLLPPVEEQEAIGATLAALDDKIRAHAEIAQVTGEFRRALADALTTGMLSAGA